MSDGLPVPDVVRQLSTPTLQLFSEQFDWVHGCPWLSSGIGEA